MNFSTFVVPIGEAFSFIPQNKQTIRLDYAKKDKISLDCAKIAKICLKDFFPKAKIDVWLVNGKFIRDNADVEFEEAGHSERYTFIPSNEVWLDHSLPIAEIYNYLLHELKERSLMLSGMEYEAAHARSSELEAYGRLHPEVIDNLLAQVIIANITASKKGV